MSEFIQHLRKYSFRYNDKLTKFCQPLFNHFGVEHFCYYKITNSGFYTTLSSHLEFSEYYFFENLHLNSPYLLHPEHYQTGISFTKNIYDDDFRNSQNLISRKFRFNLTTNYLEKGSDAVQGFALASSSRGLETLLANELPLFKLFVRRFKETFKTVLTKMQDDHVDLATPAGPLFYKKKILMNCKMENRRKFITSLGIPQLPVLTCREIQIAPLILEGCSANQIGELLYISKRTVENHIENIKIKFDSPNKSDLVHKLNEYSSLGCFES